MIPMLFFATCFSILFCWLGVSMLYYFGSLLVLFSRCSRSLFYDYLDGVFWIIIEIRSKTAPEMHTFWHTVNTFLPGTLLEIYWVSLADVAIPFAVVWYPWGILLVSVCNLLAPSLDSPGFLNISLRALLSFLRADPPSNRVIH